MNKISSMLDAVADSLEAKGYLKEAHAVDKAADAVEAAQFDSSSEIAQRAQNLKGEIQGLQTAMSKSPANQKQPGIFQKAMQDLKAVYDGVDLLISDIRMYGLKGDRAYDPSTGKSTPIY